MPSAVVTAHGEVCRALALGLTEVPGPRSARSRERRSTFSTFHAASLRVLRAEKIVVNADTTIISPYSSGAKAAAPPAINRFSTARPGVLMGHPAASIGAEHGQHQVQGQALSRIQAPPSRDADSPAHQELS